MAEFEAKTIEKFERNDERKSLAKPLSEQPRSTLNLLYSYAPIWIRWLLLVGLLASSCLAGIQQWELRKAEAQFYQFLFAPAVSVACGHGFKQLRKERQDVISDFLALKTSGLKCNEAFGPGNSPEFGDPIDIQIQQISLQYLFGLIWKFSEISWEASKYIIGGLVGATALAVFLFARQLLGFYSSLALAYWAVLSSGTILMMSINIRDFSKAPFIIGLAAVFVAIFTAKRDRLVPLAVLGGVIVSVGVGFRTDVSLFFLLLPLALCFRLFSRECFVSGLSALVCFGATAWMIDTFLLNYSPGLGRYNAHWAILGRASTYVQHLGFDIAHQGAFPWYLDEAVYGLVKFFASAAQLPDYPWPLSIQYDRNANILLARMAHLLPANYLAEGYTAAFRSIFNPISQHPAITLLALLCCSILVAMGYQRRGLAALAICIVLGGVSGVQFDPRHYFPLGVFGAVLLVAAAAVVLKWLLVTSGLDRSGVGGFLSIDWLSPQVRAPRLIYGVSVVVCFVLAAGLLVSARRYQDVQVNAMIDNIASFPQTPLVAEPRSADDTNEIITNYSGRQITQSVYMSIRKAQHQKCAQPPDIKIEYDKSPAVDMSFQLPIARGDILEFFFPIIVYPPTHTVKSIAVTDSANCKFFVSIVSPTKEFLPMIFYRKTIAGSTYHLIPFGIAGLKAF